MFSAKSGFIFFAIVSAIVGIIGLINNSFSAFIICGIGFVVLLYCAKKEDENSTSENSNNNLYNNAITTEELEILENNIKESIDGCIIHVSMLSGIPINKINKDKCIKSIREYVLNSNTIPIDNKVALTKSLMDIVWKVAKENNTFKEQKLQDCAPNSKVRIKLMQILKDSATKISSIYKINISNDSIKASIPLITGYIDKYIFSEPTEEQESDTIMPLILLALAESKNEQYITKELGSEFYEALMSASVLFLFAYEECIITNNLTPQSPRFITLLNNCNHYLNILVKHIKIDN